MALEPLPLLSRLPGHKAAATKIMRHSECGILLQPTEGLELDPAAMARSTRLFYALALQLGIPIEIVGPGLVQVVGREAASQILQLVGGRQHCA